jgi:hypothetical protein
MKTGLNILALAVTIAGGALLAQPSKVTASVSCASDAEAQAIGYCGSRSETFSVSYYCTWYGAELTQVCCHDIYARTPQCNPF